MKTTFTFQIHHDECWGKSIETNLCFICTRKVHKLSLSLKCYKQIHKVKSSHMHLWTHTPFRVERKERGTPKAA